MGSEMGEEDDLTPPSGGRGSSEPVLGFAVGPVPTCTGSRARVYTKAHNEDV